MNTEPTITLKMERREYDGTCNIFAIDELHTVDRERLLHNIVTVSGHRNGNAKPSTPAPHLSSIALSYVTLSSSSTPFMLLFRLSHVVFFACYSSSYLGSGGCEAPQLLCRGRKCLLPSKSGLHVRTMKNVDG